MMTSNNAPQHSRAGRHAALLATAIVLGGVFTPLADSAEEKTVTVEGIRGVTLEVAVQQGLVRALEKVQGVSVRSTQGARLRHAETSREATGLLKKHFERTTFDDVSGGHILKETNGIISSYTVLTQEQDPTTKHWTVSLSVVVPVYDPENPRPGSKRTMVVLPFKIADRAFHLGSARISGRELQRKFLSRSTSHLTKSARFLMLDRNSAAEVEKERDLIRSGNAPLKEKLALGQAYGADLLVNGALEELSWTSREVVVQPTGYRTVKNVLRYRVTFEVIRVATGEIEHADEVLGILGDGELKQLPDETLDLRSDDMLVDLAAQGLAVKILEAIYPVKVVKVEDQRHTLVNGTRRRGIVTLNQGGVRVKVGDAFEIHATGTELIDPDTGESLGVEEELVARVTVIEVKPRYSRAVVIEGDLDRIKRGAICHRN